jgi:hypothetical protein
VERHGADLRLALTLADGEERQTPTQQVDAAEEHVERLDSRLAEVMAERDGAKIERDKARDTLRKSTARSVVYRQAAGAVRDKEREKAAKARKAASKKETARRQQLVNARLAAVLERRSARVLEPDVVQARKLAKARKRARCVEEQAKLSQKRLRRAQDAESDLKAAQSKLDDWAALAVQAKAVCDEYTGVKQLVAEMPTWQRVRGKGAGKGAKALEASYYEAIWKQLMNGTPLSAVPKNIVSVVRITAPWLKPVEPTIEACRESRFALGTGEMTMSARRIAEAFRVRQMGIDETTKFQDPSMVTSVLVQPTEGAPLEVVICRAAYATGGGTAELLAKAIEEKCFARLRGYLRGWQAECEKRFPKHVWTGPDPERCGLQRLGGGGGIITDTCTPARCLQNLLIAEVGRQVKSKYNPASWLQLSEAQQEAAMRAHAHHCANHVRNIWLAALSKAQSAHVRAKLQDELDEFLSHERATTDFEDLIRQDYKEFHHGGRYYKGHGKLYAEHLRDNHGAAFIMHFERAEGGRQVCAYH